MYNTDDSDESDIDESDSVREGKIIQKHLEQINMDAWHYIYQNYVNPPENEDWLNFQKYSELNTWRSINHVFF